MERITSATKVGQALCCLGSAELHLTCLDIPFVSKNMADPIWFSIRAVEDKDRYGALELIKRSWGGDSVVVHQELFHPHKLPGFLAFRGEVQLIGLLTYQISSEVCEIITLNSLIENQGVGTNLIEAAASEAKIQGCRLLTLITTNDNQRAVDFYNKRGFHLKEIHVGAVDQARQIKPSIPRFSPEGIPIQDEWEFVRIL